MIKLLSKIFIKNPSDYSNPEVRSRYGIICGGFGIFLNIILFALKFIFGTLAKSVAMIADAFNNLSDAASSLVSLLGFKLALKKPDSEHPFGHGRMEYIAGLVISFLIFMMGFELLKSSWDALFSNEKSESTLFSYIVLGIAILVKLYMFIYNHAIAKKINSASLEAVAKDSLSDTISTFVVIASMVASKFTDFPVDGVAGFIVAAFVLKTGYESAKDTIEPLLGQPPEKEFILAVEKEVLAHKPIIGIHDMVVHDYGPGRVMVSLHAEVPGDQNIFDLHDVIDVTEFDLSQKFGCHVVIHMDPVETDNPLLEELKLYLKSVLPEIAEGLSIHDVRIVPGNTHTNLIYDVVKPFECELTDEELKKKLFEIVNRKYSTVMSVITVDSPFV
ncbi:MAG: cation transporter [Treponema sp.]|nr:cation transporter [Candidatus Treponema equifaecale]